MANWLTQHWFDEMASGANHSRLTSLTYPNGRVLEYVYSAGLDDSISRLSLLADASGGSPAPAVEEYSYLGLGTVVERKHAQPNVNLTYLVSGSGDGGDQYLGLDRFGRVVEQRWDNAGTATDQFSYSYDRDSNRLTKANVLNSTFDEAYGYDLLNQLTSFAQGSTHTQSWDLDALGNWNTVTTDGNPQSRTHNRQNQLTAVGGSTLTFDNNGNTTTDDAGRTLTYDAWNRLASATSGSSTVTFTYDALNRRLTETVSGTTTDLYYSALWQVMEERVSGAATAQYVWSPAYVDALVLRDRDTNGDGTLEERLYAQQDANYNVTALLDAAGNVVERYVYDPYGKSVVLSASWAPLSQSAYGWQYRWQGLKLVEATDLYHARRREVSATLGRPVQRDPIEFGAGDPNLYRWEGNGPTGRMDPFGLFVGAPAAAAPVLANPVTGGAVAVGVGVTAVGGLLYLLGDATVDLIAANNQAAELEAKRLLLLEKTRITLPRDADFTGSGGSFAPEPKPQTKPQTKPEPKPDPVRVDPKCDDKKKEEKKWYHGTHSGETVSTLGLYLTAFLANDPEEADKGFFVTQTEAFAREAAVRKTSWINFRDKTTHTPVLLVADDAVIRPFLRSPAVALEGGEEGEMYIPVELFPMVPRNAFRRTL